MVYVMKFLSMAKYGALHGVSAMAVSKWKARGWLVFQGNKVDVTSSNANLEKYRSEPKYDHKPDPKPDEVNTSLDVTPQKGLNQLSKAELDRLLQAQKVAIAEYEKRQAKWDTDLREGRLLKTEDVESTNSRRCLGLRNKLLAIPSEHAIQMANCGNDPAKAADITREDQDVFAYTSQQRAVSVIKEDKFKEEIIPIEVKVSKKQTKILDTDEHPRAETTVEGLAKLSPIVPGGTVTAGNACGINDGASLMMLMSEKKAQELNIKPIAKIRGYASAGVEMHIFGIGPAPAIKASLKRANLNPGDMGLIEINEAFAAQVIACEKELGLDHNIVNVNGGAIALGHALGNTGTRISITLLKEMVRRKCKYGVSSACIGSGLGIAVVWENLTI